MGTRPPVIHARRGVVCFFARDGHGGGPNLHTRGNEAYDDGPCIDGGVCERGVHFATGIPRHAQGEGGDRRRNAFLVHVHVRSTGSLPPCVRRLVSSSHDLHPVSAHALISPPFAPPPLARACTLSRSLGPPRCKCRVALPCVRPCLNKDRMSDAAVEGTDGRRSRSCVQDSFQCYGPMRIVAYVPRLRSASRRHFGTARQSNSPPKEAYAR